MKKKTLKKVIPLAVCAVLIVGALLYFFMPPSVNNYGLRLSVNLIGGKQSVYTNSEYQSMEIQPGGECSILSEVINASARWQIARFSEGELLKISIYNGDEKIYEQKDQLNGKYTFPWKKGCRCFSEYMLDFSYTFEEAGTYTVVATSSFKQLWKSYSYQTEVLTVIVK